MGTHSTVFFSGLCGLIHSAGERQARVVLLDPEATGGPRHRPTLLLRGDETLQITPDAVVGDVSSEGAYGVWDLTGCHVRVVTDDPLTLMMHEPEWECFRESPNDPQCQEHERRSDLWTSLRLLQDPSELSGVSRLAPEQTWPQAGLVTLEGGTVQAVEPASAALRNARYNFRRSNQTSSIWQEYRPLALRFKVISPWIELWIERGSHRRRVRLSGKQQAVIANTSLGAGSSHLHDDVAYRLLDGATPPIREQLELLHIHDPDACGSFRIFVEPTAQHSEV